MVTHNAARRGNPNNSPNNRVFKCSRIIRWGWNRGIHPLHYDRFSRTSSSICACVTAVERRTSERSTEVHIVLEIHILFVAQPPDFQYAISPSTTRQHWLTVTRTVTRRDHPLSYGLPCCLSLPAALTAASLPCSCKSA